MQDRAIFQDVARDLDLRLPQVTNTMALLDDDNTVPFIARYRKERTGELNEEQIRRIQEQVAYRRSLEQRKDTILKSIADQDKLTPELEDRIRQTTQLQELEDLYLPYKPKKRTRGMVAKKKGLQPLADRILAQETLSGDPQDYARKYIDPSKDLASEAEVMQGARDIIAETVSENADIRKKIRHFTYRHGLLVSQATNAGQTSVYEMYYDYREPLRKLRSHRVLALNRGEKEKYLKVSIDVDPERIHAIIAQQYLRDQASIFNDHLKMALQDGYKRLIRPSIERELRNSLTEKAEKRAIQVFATNLKNLLLQPPLKNKIIMGIDPGYRTGCKVAVIDQTGKYLQGTTIYPHPPRNQYQPARQELLKLIDQYQVTVIAIGNGTASRETEQLIVDLLDEYQGTAELGYVIVDEAGASVYSASPLAKQEFPELEAALRGNISIARRLLDPLSELVKIDPKSIGVGQYQHDVNQKLLNQTLHNVVEDCVNHVGVNLNTASAALLQYVSGLTRRSAANIVAYREKQGAFKTRAELTRVSGIGVNTFEQAAGFLRVPDGANPLDNTSIHPESYPVTRQLLQKFKISDIHQGGKMLGFKLDMEKIDLAQLAAELDVGLPTLRDILDNLKKPGRDPREDLPPPILKSDILTMDDLKTDMILQGTVRNVVDFGVFVDLGLKQDGLIHISELSHKYVKDPNNLVAVGDRVKVRILSVDKERQRIALSMKGL